MGKSTTRRPVPGVKKFPAPRLGFNLVPILLFPRATDRSGGREGELFTNFLHNGLIPLFFTGLFLSLWLTPASIRLSRLVNAIDLPDDRKVHKRAVSRLGGLAMVIGLAVPLSVFLNMDRTLVAFLSGAAIVAATGFLDDVYRIRPAAKFLGEVAAASVFVAVSGVSLHGLGDFLGIGEIRTGLLAPYITVFCMVGVMNALNLSDGLDGLAGGIGAIACTFLGVFAYVSGDWVSLAILAALLGSIFGFLRHNTYPANLFMGDTGSLFLGYSLSALAVLLIRNAGGGVHLSPVAVAAVLGLPILDTLLVMLRRIAHRTNPFLPDKTHLHHRLLDLGLPHSAVVTILYVSSAAFGFVAWGLRLQPEWMQFAAVLALGTAIHGSVALARRGGKGMQILLSSILEKSVGMMGWVIGIGLFLPTTVLSSVPRSISVAALAAGGFVVALFPWRSWVVRSSVSHAILFAACVSLLAILHFSPGAPGWLSVYFAAFSAVVAVWVLLQIKYRGHREILNLSAFEMLLIGVSWFVPIVLVPAMGLDDVVRTQMFTICLESGAILMAVKILVRRQPSRNYALVATFLVALALIGAKGYFVGDVVASSFPPVDVTSNTVIQVSALPALRKPVP